MAVLFFAGTLAPAIGFFDVYPFRFSFVADHFQYIACIGLIALAAVTATRISQWAGQRGNDLGTVAAPIVLLILGVSTWRQAHIYQDSETLWRDTVAKNPQGWLAHNNLGDLLAEKGELQESIWYCEQALRICPNCAEPHHCLALALVRQGKVEEAIGQFEQALRIRPNYAEAHDNLGLALTQAGKLQDAIRQFEQALRIEADNPEAHNNLANALLLLGKVQEAIVQYDQALRIKPDYAAAQYNLGVALARRSREQEAINH